jgi:hypothetical protein
MVGSCKRSFGLHKMKDFFNILGTVSFSVRILRNGVSRLTEISYSHEEYFHFWLVTGQPLETAVGRGTMDRRNGSVSFPSIYLSINQ